MHVSPCLHLCGCIPDHRNADIPRKEEKAPRLAHPSILGYLGQRPPHRDSLLHCICPVRVSSVPGAWGGERILDPDTALPGGVRSVKNNQRAFRPLLCGGCSFHLLFAQRQVHCLCPVQEALYLQECKGDCDSSDRRLSLQRRPTDGPPCAQGRREPSRRWEGVRADPTANF